MSILDIHAVHKAYLRLRRPDQIIEDALRAAERELLSSTVESACLLANLRFVIRKHARVGQRDQNMVGLPTCNGSSNEDLFAFDVQDDRVIFSSRDSRFEVACTEADILDAVGKLLSSKRSVEALAGEAMHRRRTRNEVLR